MQKTQDAEMTDVAGKSTDMPLPNHFPLTAHDANVMDLNESSHPRLTTVPSDPRRRALPDS